MKNNTSFIQGLPTVKWNNNYSNGGTPHDGYCVDTDYFLFRVAEAYLIAAEADMHINGEGSATAKDYLDKIRKRANAATKSSYTLDDVLDERARELYAERQRWTDLRRTKQLVRYNVEFNNYISKAADMANVAGEYKWLRPIPQEEISSNTGINDTDQNPGY